MAGISFEVDDKDQNHVITFKSQSLHVILGVLQKHLEQYCSEKTTLHKPRNGTFPVSSPICPLLLSYFPYEQGEDPTCMEDEIQIILAKLHRYSKL